MKNKTVIGLKDLRENTEEYISKVQNGKSFVVVRRSRPVFKISPPEEDADLWEEIIDFTKVKKGGVEIAKIISRL
jgi:prevent-host-death family protein